jgi:hypothetical protein
MLDHPDRATGLANVALIGAAEERAETRLRAGPSGLGLTLGHYGRRDRVFAYGALADGIFADWIFADRRGGRDRLRPWEVGSNRCSHESQRHRANDRESQHRSPLAAKVILELTLRSLTAQQKGSRAHVSAILFRWMLQNWHLVWACDGHRVGRTDNRLHHCAYRRNCASLFPRKHLVRARCCLGFGSQHRVVWVAKDKYLRSAPDDPFQFNERAHL